MNEEHDPHAPTPEFREALARDISRTYRSEEQFGVPRSMRARRIGMLIGAPLGAFAILMIGFVLGSSSTYASAEVPTSRPAAAATMMRNALSVITCGMVAAATPAPAPAQQGIPVVDVPAPNARTSETFGAILGLKQGADGKVLVNDAARRQLKLLDQSLASSVVVLDSAPGTSTSYGSRPLAMNSWLGDSVLFADFNARTLLVLDGHGALSHALALPNNGNLGSIVRAVSAVDNKGRIIFRTGRPRVPNAPPRTTVFSDSIMIFRADLDERRTDTIGVMSLPLMKITTEKSSDNRTTTVWALDPLQPIDEWGMLSNGTVGIVRGLDYHIDWLHPDGTTSRSPKLPMDWRRLDDTAKTRLIDSVKVAQNALLAIGYPSAETYMRVGPTCDAIQVSEGAGRGGRSGAAAPTGQPIAPASGECTQMSMRGAPMAANEFDNALAMLMRGSLPPVLELTRAGVVADYRPPFRLGAVLTDQDDNMWILPRETKLSRNGELVYDVVNAKGELFKRVRLPAGRAIAGFGKGGVIYMTSGDKNAGYTLERSKLP